jgi:hypothetical protein
MAEKPARCNSGGSGQITDRFQTDTHAAGQIALFDIRSHEMDQGTDTGNLVPDTSGFMATQEKSIMNHIYVFMKPHIIERQNPEGQGKFKIFSNHSFKK